VERPGSLSGDRPADGTGMPIKRWSIFIFAVVTYLLFLPTVLYAIGFVGNVFVP
jgi:hypothetical protein